MIETNPGPARKSLARFAPIALIFAALATALVFRVHEQFSLNALYAQSDAIDAFVARNYALAIALFMLVYGAAVASSVPGASFLTLSGGFLFGTFTGGAAAWIAATIGATLIFLAARTAFGDLLRARVGGWLERLGSGLREHAFSYLLVLRLTPIAPFFVVNLAPAFFNVGLRDYVLATLIGMIPGAFVYASVGAGLRAALIALALLPIAIKALRRPHAETPA